MSARIIHIEPDGNDVTGDGSALRPFATLGRAVQEQQFRDVIVEGYEYGEWPEPQPEPAPKMRESTALGLAFVAILGLAGLAVLLAHNPSAAVLVAAVLAMAVGVVFTGSNEAKA